MELTIIIAVSLINKIHVSTDFLLMILPF